MNCPCNSGAAFETCCGQYLAGKRAPTAEALMRSRYTAYTQGNIGYIKKTMEAPLNEESARQWASSVVWLGLEIIDVTPHEVEFKASYIQNGQPMVLHERSTFSYKKEKWIYVSGVINRH